MILMTKIPINNISFRTMLIYYIFKQNAAQLPRKRFQDNNAVSKNRFLNSYPQIQSQKYSTLNQPQKLESTNSSLISQLSQLKIGGKQKSSHPHGMDISVQRTTNLANQFVRRDTNFPGQSSFQNPFSLKDREYVSQNRGQRKDQSPIGVVHNGVFKARPVPKQIYETPQEFVNFQQIKNSRAQQPDQSFNFLKRKETCIQKSRSLTEFTQIQGCSNYSVQASLNSTAERERIHQFPTETQPFANPFNGQQQLNHSSIDDELLQYPNQRSENIEPLNLDQEDAEFVRSAFPRFSLITTSTLNITKQYHKRSRSFEFEGRNFAQNLTSKIFHGDSVISQQQQPDFHLNPFSASQFQTQTRNLFVESVTSIRCQQNH